MNGSLFPSLPFGKWFLVLTLFAAGPLAEGSLYRQTILDDNPVAYWRLGETGPVVDGVTQVVDETTSHHGNWYTYPNHGSTGGPVAGLPGALLHDPDSAAQFGQPRAGNLYASGGAVVLDTSADFDLAAHQTTGFSIEVWWKVPLVIDAHPSLANTLPFFSRGAVSNGTGYTFGIGGLTVNNGAGQIDNIHFTPYGAGSVGLSTGPLAYQVDQWYHLVFTFDADRTGRLYLDGQQIASRVNLNLATTAANPAMIGAIYNVGMTNSQKIYTPFPGLLDEVALYHYALTPEQILEHYQVANIPEPGFVSLVALGGVLLLTLRRSRRSLLALGLGAIVTVIPQAKAEILFKADFNDTTDAVHAKGGGEGTVAEEVSYTEGINGRAALLRAGHRLAYPAEGNLSLDAGTALLWVKAINWDWQATPFVEFLTVDHPDPSDRSILLLYKYLDPGAERGLFFLLGQIRHEEGQPKWSVAKEKVEGGRQEEWMLLGATWDRQAGLMHLYLNGEEVAYTKVPADQWPQTLPQRFSVLHTTRAPFDPLMETAVDSVVIEDRALSASEIEGYYLQTRPATDQLKAASIPPAHALAPRLSQAPVADGHYGANEWAQAATLSGFSVFKTPRTPAAEQTIVHVGYDDRFFHVAYLSPQPFGAPLVAETKDGSDLRGLSRDDTIELFLSPKSGGSVYQLLMNSKGVYAGLRGEHFSAMKPDWKPQIVVANQIYEQRWLCELAIPYEALGLDRPPAQGETWRVNFARNWANASSSGDSLQTSWSFASQAFARDLGTLTFSSKGAYPQLLLESEGLASRRLVGRLSLGAPDEKPVEAVLKITAADGRLLLEEKRALSAAQPEFPFDLPVPEPLTLTTLSVIPSDGAPLLTQTLPLVYPAGVVVTPQIHAARQQVDFHVQTGKAADAEARLTGEVELLDDEGRSRAKVPLEFGPQGAVARVDLAPLPDQEYQLRVALMEDGKIVEERTQIFEKLLEPVWLKEKPGVSRAVLPPWTPLRLEGKTIHLQGRSYRFGEGLLPTAIEVGGEALLHAPATVAISSEGRPLNFSGLKIKEEEVAPDRIVLVMEQESEEVTLRSRLTLEYDGMAKVELEVSPRKEGVSLDRLALHFPLVRQPETLLHTHSFAWSDMIRRRLEGDFQSKFRPYLWLGREERGLAWFSESDQHWNNREEPIAIRQSGASTDLHLSLIDHATPLRAARSYTFGFQATPVKPPLAQRKAIRFHQPGMTHISPWGLADRSLKRYHEQDPEWGWLSPHIGNYEGLTRELAAFRAKGITVPVYVAPTITSPLSPAYQLFRESWRNPHGSYPFACAGSTFTDEWLWNVDQQKQRSALESIYVDCGWAYSCGNHHHHCGYRAEDGSPRLTYPIFALREAFKRLYTIIHDPQNPNALVWIHASGLAAAPVHAFADILTQGEEVRSEVIANPNYFEIYSLDTWRVTYGKALGIEHQFLPEFADASVKEERYSPIANAKFLTMALLHDTMIWGEYCDPAYLSGIYQLLDTHGFANPSLRYDPYWQQQMVSVAAPLRVTLYHLPEHTLAIIGNPTKEAVTTTLEVDAAKPGWSQGAQTEVLWNDSKEEAFTVLPENFAIVKLSPRRLAAP